MARRLVLLFVRNLIPILIGIGGIAAFTWYVIGNLTDFNFPAEGVASDFINRLFASEFRFFSLPHFNWHSDWFLYPYGVDITFIFWAFEQNVLQTMCERLFSSFFPNQWYYVLSLLITYFGVYALISPRKGRLWGTVFAFALTFCNYASICKFPGHFSHCIVHWITLSILTDAILVEKFWSRERISAAFWQWRILLWFLCLGLEMGYLAGLALAVSFFAGVYMLIALVVVERSWRGVIGRLRGLVCDFLTTYGRAKTFNAVLSALIALVAWTYLPIVLQIMAHSSVITEKTVIWATHPLRLFIPILPGLNPSTVTDPRLANVDTAYAWNAGWTFLLIFVFAILRGGLKGLRYTFPFLLLFVLLLLLSKFPVLTYLPMFKCSRIPERFSPGVIVFLLIPLFYVVSRRSIAVWRRFVHEKWEILLLLASLFAVELVTAYALTFPPVQMRRLTDFPVEYRVAVREVRKMPGEGIFFMPFSAHGGDGNGLVQYHLLTAHQMQFAAMCGKKMNGCYLGRMVPDLYLRDFSQFGWPRYLGTGQRWTTRKWRSFETFLSNSDFCALAVDKNQVSPEVYADLVAHFGTPVCEFGMFGECYAVLRVPLQLRGRKNLQAIRAIELALDECTPGEIMSFATDLNCIALGDGMSAVEPWGVWSCAETCSFSLMLPQGGPRDGWTLSILAHAYERMREAIIFCNDEQIARWDVGDHRAIERTLRIPAKFSGQCVTLRFEQHDVVSPHALDPGKGDSRTLGLGFLSIRLLPAQEAEAK